MMAALEAGVFSSKQFIFVIGKNKTEYPVHAAVITKHSKALDVLINGPMVEASDGKATFDDVEEDTFARFCQFAYTGNYATPEFKRDTAVELPDRSPSVSMSDEELPAILSPEPEPEPEAPPEPELDDGWPKIKIPKAKKLSKSRKLRQLLDNKFYDTEPPLKISTALCEVRQNTSLIEDYTTVFLGHAQLYVFAEKWGIEALKTLILFKLHKTLVSFTLYSVRRHDVVELLRFAYSNDHTPDRFDVVDDLRSLVMLYVGCEVESLVQCPEFLSLVGEGGQLAEDLVQVMVKRIG